MTIETERNLTPVNIIHLKSFKKFLEESVLERLARLSIRKDYGEIDSLMKDCALYTAHLDALLGEK